MIPPATDPPGIWQERTENVSGARNHERVKKASNKEDTVLRKIISGGQTGADQAGLDVAIHHGIPHGGAIPRGRLTEAGALPEKYKLDEMTTRSYPKRTEKNVLDSDGTVIFTHGKLRGGSLLTHVKAQEHGKPVIHLDMAENGVADAATTLSLFIHMNGIEVLNIAGTRGSEDPAIYTRTFQVLEKTLSKLMGL